MADVKIRPLKECFVKLPVDYIGIHSFKNEKSRERERGETSNLDAFPSPPPAPMCYGHSVQYLVGLVPDATAVEDDSVLCVHLFCLTPVLAPGFPVWSQ